MAAEVILDKVYEREASPEWANRIWLTQPVGGGPVKDYTHKEAIDRARRMAAYLKSKGFEPGSKIAIISKNCAHFFITELAIWMAGYTTVALYPTLDSDTVSYILEHSDSKLCFVGKLDVWDSMKDGVPDDMEKIAFPLAPSGHGFKTFDDVVAETEPIEGNPTRDLDDICLIIYTSGSTGKPKGVMHNFRAATVCAKGIIDEYDLTPEDRCLSYLPLAHIFERAFIACVSYYGGGRIFFAESIDTFVQDLQRATPTFFISVPRLWLKFQLGVFKKMPPERLDFLLKIPIVNNIIRKKILTGLGLEHVRLAGSGSAPIPADLIAWYRKLGLNLMEGYAMSEDFAYSHRSTLEYNEPGYVGTPFKGVDVRISDEGEIQIKSPGAMVGYYKEPEMTKEAFTEDGYFKTGDRGERKPNGMLKITGRVKEIFKTAKGKYIAPAKIENHLNNDSNIELSCVSGVGRPQPYAQIVLSEDLRDKIGEAGVKERVDKELHELLTELNGKLSSVEKLQFLVVVKEAWDIENGFLTPTMKIRRGAIEDATEKFVDGWYENPDKVIWL